MQTYNDYLASVLRAYKAPEKERCAICRSTYEPLYMIGPICKGCKADPIHR